MDVNGETQTATFFGRTFRAEGFPADASLAGTSATNDSADMQSRGDAGDNLLSIYAR